MSATSVITNDSIVVSESARDRRVRLCYSRIDGRTLEYVIVDVGPDGQEDWSAQECGEMRWYPFAPSDEDRDLVRGWIDAGECPSDWPLFVVPSRHRCRS